MKTNVPCSYFVVCHPVAETCSTSTCRRLQ